MSRTWGSCTINARQTLTYSTVSTVSELHTVFPQQACFSAGKRSGGRSGGLPTPWRGPSRPLQPDDKHQLPHERVIYKKKKTSHSYRSPTAAEPQGNRWSWGCQHAAHVRWRAWQLTVRVSLKTWNVVLQYVSVSCRRIRDENREVFRLCAVGFPLTLHSIAVSQQRKPTAPWSRLHEKLTLPKPCCAPWRAESIRSLIDGTRSVSFYLVNCSR